MLYEIEGRTVEMRAALLASWHTPTRPWHCLRGSHGRNSHACLWAHSIVTWKETGPTTIASGSGVPFWMSGPAALTPLPRGSIPASRTRPDDPVVWRARLELAEAKADVDQAWKALEHLPAAGFSEVEIARIRAWLASREHDPASETAALNALIKQDPGDTVALNRLASLASLAGDSKQEARVSRNYRDHSLQEPLPLPDQRCLLDF